MLAGGLGAYELGQRQLATHLTVVGKKVRTDVRDWMGQGPSKGLKVRTRGR